MRDIPTFIYYNEIIIIILKCIINFSVLKEQGTIDEGEMNYEPKRFREFT